MLSRIVRFVTARAASPKMTLASAASVASQDSQRDVTRICDPVVVASDGPSPLTPEMIKQFHTRGYIIVRNLVSENDCSKVQRACERLVDTEANELTNADPPLIADAKTDSPFSRRLFDLFCEAGMDMSPLLFRKELHKDGFEAIFCNDQLICAVRQLLHEADEIRIFPNYTCRPKFPAHDGQVICWHQDAGVRPDGGPNTSPADERMRAFGPRSMVNAWMPLVQEATRHNGAMKFVPESHRLGCVPHQILGEYRDTSVTAEAAQAAAEAEDAPVGTFSTGIAPDIVAEHEDKFVWVECRRGDVVLFSNLLFHCGGENRSSDIRWSFDWRYQDASQPTHRPQQGHIVYSARDADRGPDTKRRWSNLVLE